ncbi:MAG: class I SAM-dependent methyltransferase [Ignavibacteriales bacterium]|nr:class I SAM-dependent methyltransferase [Ignavibacteriales bacterium]
MSPDSEIRAEEVRTCLLCKTKGTMLYAGLQDRLFDAPGMWNIFKCADCGLMWLSPRPISSDLGKAYQSYYTHNAGSDKGRMEEFIEKVARPVVMSRFGYERQADDRSARNPGASLLSHVPVVKEIAWRYVMNLHGQRGGRLLDVGCGDGSFLARMKHLGWDVMGVEPDPRAARKTQEELGIPVFNGTLTEAGFDSRSFDAITLTHVIEHVEEPGSLLRECHRILKPTGKLSIATPNIESFGHRMFGAAWRELDPPRHLHLLSLKTLAALVEGAVPLGFSVDHLGSSGVYAGQILVISRSIRLKGAWVERPLTKWQVVMTVVYFIAETIVRAFSPRAGEELLMTLTKQPGNAAHMPRSENTPGLVR